MKDFLFLISKLIRHNTIAAAGIPSYKGAYEPILLNHCKKINPS